MYIYSVKFFRKIQKIYFFVQHYLLLYKFLFFYQTNNMAGINRRLDQLGRIVLPIEIRKKLKLEEGSLIDISLSGDCLILTKSEPVKDLVSYIDDVCKCVKDCDIVCMGASEIVYCRINGKSCEGGKIDDCFFDNACKYDGAKIDECKISENIIIKNKFAYFLPLVTYGDKHGYICFFYANSATQKQEGVMNFIACYISGKL